MVRIVNGVIIDPKHPILSPPPSSIVPSLPLHSSSSSSSSVPSLNTNDYNSSHNSHLFPYMINPSELSSMFYSPYNPIWNYANYFYSYPHPSHNGVMGQTQLKEEKNIEEGNKEKTHIETSGNHNFYPAANTTTAAVVVPPVSTVPPMTRSPPLTSSLSTVPATVATAVAVPVPCVPPPSSNLFGLPDVYIYEIRVCPLVYLLAGLCIYLIGPQAIIPIVCSFFFYRWHLNKQSSSHMQAFLLNKKSNPCQSLGMYANGTYVQSNIYDDAHYTSNVSSLPVSQSQSVPPSISTSRVRRTSDSRIHSLADFKE